MPWRGLPSHQLVYGVFMKGQVPIKAKKHFSHTISCSWLNDITKFLDGLTSANEPGKVLQMGSSWLS
jgi:hypothetical protein